LGISFHQKNQLDNGYEVGNTVTDGAIPTSRGWNGFKPGFFIGVTLDSNIYRALKARTE
jgi:hypothetical protein